MFVLFLGLLMWMLERLRGTFFGVGSIVQNKDAFSFFLGVHLEVTLLSWDRKTISWEARLKICPRKTVYTFSETIRHRWCFKLDLNIGETRVWRLDSGTNLQP